METLVHRRITTKQELFLQIYSGFTRTDKDVYILPPHLVSKRRDQDFGVLEVRCSIDVFCEMIFICAVPHYEMGFPCALISIKPVPSLNHSHC